LYHLGSLYKKRQQIPQAVETLHQVLHYQPNHVEAHYTLGLIYVDLKQYRTAVSEFEAALTARPDFREAHYSLGVCYEFYLPDIAKALEHYRRFLALGGTEERVQQLVEYSRQR
jgi:tetratricopeptide (TPR) repeat protein